MDQVFDDPQVKHLGVRWPVDHPVLGEIGLVGQPLKSSLHKGGVRSVAPTPGQHSSEILAEIGYSEQTIETLRKSHVI
jgi:formyl-CoA transferase